MQFSIDRQRDREGNIPYPLAMQVHVIWHPESDALCRPIAEMIYLALNRDPYQPLLPGNPRHPLNAMIATGTDYEPPEAA